MYLLFEELSRTGVRPVRTKAKENVSIAVAIEFLIIHYKHQLDSIPTNLNLHFAHIFKAYHSRLANSHYLSSFQSQERQ